MDYPPAQMAAEMAGCQFQLLFLLLLAILVVVQRFQLAHLVPGYRVDVHPWLVVKDVSLSKVLLGRASVSAA